MFANMDGKPSVVDIIRLVAEKVEKLGVHDRHDEVEGIVGVGEDDEQRRLADSNAIQLHLVIAHQLPQLRDVKWGKPCAAANQDRLGSFARNELSRTF